MRSVVLYLTNTSKPAVEAVLSRFTKPFEGKQWTYPTKGDTTLWIRHYDEYESEFEPEDMAVLLKATGKTPAVVLLADISGRVKGEKEARLFAENMLSAFSGVAYDGCNDHYWSLAEINADAKPLGLRFFDHQGWYDKYHSGQA